MGSVYGGGSSVRGVGVGVTEVVVLTGVEVAVLKGIEVGVRW